MTPPLVAAALELQRCLDNAAIPACIIGGLAVQRWGEPRATQDVDITVLAPRGEEARALDLLLSAFTPRQDNARAFALQHRVLLLRAGNGVPLDVALAGSPFEREVLDRASPWPMAPVAVLRTCAAEDLILYKLVAGRSRDLADIEGIVRRQAGGLDAVRIREYGALFSELKDDPDLLRPFERALRILR